MRFSRDLLIVLILFVILIGLTAFTAFKQAQAEQERTRLVPYSTHSAFESGTLALQTWLDAIGYRTQRIENSTFALRDDVRALFIFAPSQKFETRDVAAVLRWVERGNTLIVVYSGFGNQTQLLSALKADIKFLGGYTDRVPLEQPLFASAQPNDIAVHTFEALTMHRNDFVEYLSAEGAPLLVSFARGQGKVWLSTTPYVFTNAGLSDPANATLVAALLNAVPRGSAVAFDEYHLGYTGSGMDEDSLQAQILNSPWGWAIIYSFLVVFAFLIVNGQRLGRVVPLPKEIARRSPAEYVISMAQLFRRGGKRAMALQHYRRSLKRSLGKPYHINPDLPDEQFVTMVTRVRPQLDREALSETLRALNQKQASEKELVRLADQAVSLMKKRNGAGG